MEGSWEDNSIFELNRIFSCHLWGCTELDTTEVTQQQQQQDLQGKLYIKVLQRKKKKWFNYKGKGENARLLPEQYLQWLKGKRGPGVRDSKYA